MSSELVRAVDPPGDRDDASDAPAPPPRPPTGLELAFVFLIALAVLLPGVWSYSLVDPWETHYGEVARRMLQDDDLVHTQWQNEGFRSKPVLTFWLMAGSMESLGVAEGGGYSGELAASPRTMLAIRLPFVLFGCLGMVAAWWMLATIIGRRVAWLGLLVLGTTPFYLFVARQGITDMTLVGSMIGAIAMFVVAQESGDTPVRPLWRFGRVRTWAIDQRHLLFLLVGGFLLWQAFYYLGYFSRPRQLPVKMGVHPGLLISGIMLFGLALLAAMELPGRAMAPVRLVAYWITAALAAAWFAIARLIGLAVRDETRALGEAPRITTRRQVYMMWCWTFLGISVLGKGLPALGIVGIVCAFYVVLLGRWRDFFHDRFELVRGFAVIWLIAVPWHVAMFFVEGKRFANEYFVTHLWNRAAKGVHGERGTFDFYASQIGYGMFLWAALIPAAIVALVLRTRQDTPQGRVRMVVAIWAITSVAFFTVVETKFHHYILPAVPALALSIAFWLDDVITGRARHVGAAALLGAGIVLVIANDMMTEQKQWIEMFVYRYDRPWPSAAPWQIDLSDGFLALGVAGAVGLVVLAIPRLQRLGVVLFAGAAIAAALWSMHVYMPRAATHWGMRDAFVEYYTSREIHGMRLVYFGARQAAADWAAPGEADGVRQRWTIDTLVPEPVHEGQPMVLRVTVKDADDKRVDHDLRLVATVTGIDAGDGEIEVTLAPGEGKKLAPVLAAANDKKAKKTRRQPIRMVDGDRLIAWQLYWRGENFWSGDEIWGPLPEWQTAFKETDNVKFKKYIEDRTLCPEGRRYWVVTEAGRVSNLKTILPTARAKETFRIENTVSNKFTLASFVL